MGCSKQSNQPSVDQSLVNQVMADTDSDGWPFWTADTIKKTNPELVLLMDTFTDTLETRVIHQQVFPIKE